MADTFLSVVDADDAVVGRELRSVIHKTGLRHREVHVWFATNGGELIFQKRGPNKDTYPNLLDATAGGHVEEGQDYLQAALAEVREETGLSLMATDLMQLTKVDAAQIDKNSTTNNVVFRMVYLYRFSGKTEDLQVEEMDGAGFVAVPVGKVLNTYEVVDAVPGLQAAYYEPVWQAMRDALAIS